MAAGNTYIPIATISPSGTALITFSSIPATYTDLRIVVASAVNVGLHNISLQYNGDTAANYSRTSLFGDGSSAGSFRESNFSTLGLERYAYLSTGECVYTIDIMNYANTTTYKTLLCRANNAGVGTSATVGLWRSTAAITSISIAITGSSFTAGSQASLYGILAA